MVGEAVGSPVVCQPLPPETWCLGAGQLSHFDSVSSRGHIARSRRILAQRWERPEVRVLDFDLLLFDLDV